MTAQPDRPLPAGPGASGARWLRSQGGDAGTSRLAEAACPQGGHQGRADLWARARGRATSSRNLPVESSSAPRLVFSTLTLPSQPLARNTLADSPTSAGTSTVRARLPYVASITGFESVPRKHVSAFGPSAGGYASEGQSTARAGIKATSCSATTRPRSVT